ncbi:interphotoreceptor matrix proteoglycan 1-like isoform X2, partial [Clarias magur]
MRPGSVAVHYAVVFETEVESTGTGPSGTVGESGTEIALKNMILKALREDTSLPLNIHFLSLEATTQDHSKDLQTDKPTHLPVIISKQAAAAISEEITESITYSEEKADHNGTQGRDKEAMERTFPAQETCKDLPTVTTLVTITKPSPPKPSLGPKLKEAVQQKLFNQPEGCKRNISSASTSNKTEVDQALEIASMTSSLNLNSSKALLLFLQSSLNGFKELHILTFRNGSVVVNNKMKLPVVDNITKAVHCTLDDFSNAASERLDSEMDNQSAHHGDPCKYMDCNEFSHCVVNTLTTEAGCQCDPGYSTVDGLPCQSICNLQPNYCLNGGLCESIPGNGISCRCPAGKFWYYEGERCSELVSVPVDPFIFVLYLMGSLIVVCAVIGLLVLINRKCIRTRKAVTLVHSDSSLCMEGIMRVNPVFENDDGVLTHVSSISYPTITDSGSPQSSDQGSFYSLDNMPLSTELPRQLYTTRSEKLDSEILGFHHCIPHVE